MADKCISHFIIHFFQIHKRQQVTYYQCRRITYHGDPYRYINFWSLNSSRGRQVYFPSYHSFFSDSQKTTSDLLVVSENHLSWGSIQIYRFLESQFQSWQTSVFPILSFIFSGSQKTTSDLLVVSEEHLSRDPELRTYI